jgi:hypothetical protein
MYENVTQPYLVKQITPASDMTATLTLVKYDPALYIDGNVPEWKPGFGDDMINTTDVAVVGLAATTNLVYHFRYPFCQFNLVWQHSGFPADTYYIIARNQDGVQRAIGETKQDFFTWELDVVRDIGWTGIVRFEVIPLTATGLQGRAATVEALTLEDSKSPNDITGFTVNIQDMTTSIFWDANTDIDIKHYELRYSPDVITGNWKASQLVDYLPYDVTRTSVGSRTGIYFLQSTDTSGNKSNIVWQRTTIEYLPSVNQIFEVNDANTGWNGSFSDTELVAGNVQLVGEYGDVAEAGYYYFHGFLDLTDIYEVRISSKLIAYGIHGRDEMVYWTPIAEAKPLARANAADWNVRLEYRTVDQVEVMDNWPTLDDAICNPLEEDYENYWSVWRPIEVGDVTARLLQFRVLMESFNFDVRPILIDGLVEVDAVDRTWRKNDVSVPIGGTRILYDPPFMAKPTLAINMENTTAVRYEITNHNRSGFDIRLYDTVARAEVAGQIDVSALGMGREKTTSI